MGSSWYINGDPPAEGEDVLASEDVPEVPVVSVVGFTVQPGEVGGYEVVILSLDVSDGDETAVLNFALPSEDMLVIARQGIHVASGVRPFQVQQRIIDLVVKENTDK